MNIKNVISFKKIKENINPNKLSDLIKKKIASKLDITPSRIDIKNIDMKNLKIEVVILKRNAESLDKKTNKVVEELYDIITKYNISIKDNSSIVVILHDITYNTINPTNEPFQNNISTIELDNNAWKKNHGK